MLKQVVVLVVLCALVYCSELSFTGTFDSKKALIKKLEELNIDLAIGATSAASSSRMKLSRVAATEAFLFVQGGSMTRKFLNKFKGPSAKFCLQHFALYYRTVDDIVSPVAFKKAPKCMFKLTTAYL